MWLGGLSGAPIVALLLLPNFTVAAGRCRVILSMCWGPVQAAQGGGGAGGAGGPLDFLRTNPQFIALRQIVQNNPMILQPMLQARGLFHASLALALCTHAATWGSLLLA